MKKSLKTTRFLTQAAIIAALYAALTLLLQPISGFQGNFQLRVSEALTLLPVFTPAAVPGLFVGCLIANLLEALRCWTSSSAPWPPSWPRS